MGVGGQPHAPAALPPGKTRYPLCRRLGGPQGWSGRVWKISPPPGFDPRTVHSVANSYTDWAIPAAVYACAMCDFHNKCLYVLIEKGSVLFWRSNQIFYSNVILQIFSLVVCVSSLKYLLEISKMFCESVSVSPFPELCSRLVSGRRSRPCCWSVLSDDKAKK